MCIFSGKVAGVARTNIYAGELAGGFHVLVYQMDVNNPDPVAMVLPVPVSRAGHENFGAAEEGAVFINLKHCPDFFAKLADLFPASKGVTPAGRAPSRLKVHDVGDFIASYVPTLDHFNRLDNRFRLRDSVLDRLHGYATYGFAVFQLKPGRDPKRVHPMAYRYVPHDPGRLFFPTVHVHDGHTLQDREHFDHELYYQESDTFPIQHFGEASRPPDNAFDLREVCGILRPGRRLGRFSLRGLYDNTDHVVAGPNLKPVKPWR